LSNIISLSNYYIFEFPDVMAAKRPRDWTRREAKEYFEWFMRIKDDRVAQLLHVAEAPESLSRETMLARVTETLRRSMANMVEYDTKGVQTANGLGLIAGFDAAIVIAEQLIAADDNASWQIMETTVKTLISRNLPVVRSTPKGMEFEPIWRGRMLLSLVGRESDREPTNVLDVVFNRWLKQLTIVPPP
jgi:hypothetical protein